jgi:hypothetical protein
MATATGAYATAALVKARLFAAGVTDTADDTLIGTICDQVNQFIESPQGCGRVLAPRPVGSGVASANEIQSVTLAKSVGNVTGGHWTLTFEGSTTTDLAWNVNGAALQVALRLLPTINGENVTVTGDGPYAVEFIGDRAGRAQQLMTADAAHLTVAPCTATVALVSTPQDATFLVDGNGLRRLYFPSGLRSVSELKIGDYTGDTRDTVASTDYFLRPTLSDRKPGWPAEWITLSDLPAGAHRVFHKGFETVSITATIGWAAIPDDITDVALTTAVRAWQARQSGQADVIGNDETGAPLVSRNVAPFHWKTIQAYRVRRQLVHG